MIQRYAVFQLLLATMATFLYQPVIWKQGKVLQAKDKHQMDSDKSAKVSDKKML